MLSSLAERCSGTVLWIAEFCRADEALALSRVSQSWYAELLHPGIWQRYLTGSGEMLARTVLAEGAGEVFAGPAVHPENFRAIVAGLRDPGWFRHYPGMKRLAASGQLREKLEAAPGRLGELRGSLRAQAIGRELQARCRAEAGRRVLACHVTTPPRLRRRTSDPTPAKALKAKTANPAAKAAKAALLVQAAASAVAKTSEARSRSSSTSSTSSSSSSSSSFRSKQPGASPPRREATPPRSRRRGNSEAATPERPSRTKEVPSNGRISWADGRTYEGGILHGKPEGFGKLASPEGKEYEGHFRAGQPHGQGILRGGRGGSSYEGEFVSGKRHGKGRQTLADGRVYTGTFVTGEAKGDGLLLSPDGQVLFEGRFEAALKRWDSSLLVKPAGQARPEAF
mmetsp:Transcript_35106/g.63804  ORF Transcript_35106/g.63804 Transcript_35106/m.63804 type:complete len:397 (-) Transcript_35106:26-1216(-)